MNNRTIRTSEDITKNGAVFRVRVEVSENAGDSPRERGNLSTMVLAHRRYALPHEGELAARIDTGLADYKFSTVARWLRVFHGATVVLPVWGYDHSEFSLKAGERAGSFSDPWDSGLVGIVYDSPAGREECGTPPELIETEMLREVSVYDQWARGEVYSYVVERRTNEGDWEEVDSCHEYYSVDEAMSEGKATL